MLKSRCVWKGLKTVNENIASTQLTAGYLNRLATSRYWNNKNCLSLGWIASSFFSITALIFWEWFSNCGPGLYEPLMPFRDLWDSHCFQILSPNCAVVLQILHDRWEFCDSDAIIQWANDCHFTTKSICQRDMLTSMRLHHFPRDMDLTLVFISRLVNKENRHWWYNRILWILGLQGWIGGHCAKWNKPGTERQRKTNISSLSIHLWILPCSSLVVFVLHGSIQILLGWTRAQQFSFLSLIFGSPSS